MIDPKRLHDELELRRAIDRERAHERKHEIGLIITLVVLAFAFIQWWFFERPLKIARLTPQQLRLRRQLWIIAVFLALVVLCILGSIN